MTDFSLLAYPMMALNNILTRTGWQANRVSKSDRFLKGRCKNIFVAIPFTLYITISFLQISLLLLSADVEQVSYKN